MLYKPHFQCNGGEGSTPEQAAAFINSYLDDDSSTAPPKKTDFVAVGEWENTDAIPIGNPDSYGSIGSVCGYDWTP